MITGDDAQYYLEVKSSGYKIEYKIVLKVNRVSNEIWSDNQEYKIDRKCQGKTKKKWRRELRDDESDMSYLQCPPQTASGISNTHPASIYCHNLLSQRHQYSWHVEKEEEEEEEEEENLVLTSVSLLLSAFHPLLVIIVFVQKKKKTKIPVNIATRNSNAERNPNTKPWDLILPSKLFAQTDDYWEEEGGARIQVSKKHKRN